jgi:hypothetical protein
LSFRRKLLLVFALTVSLSVGAVTIIVSTVTRRAFERADENQTTALIAQFRREFSRRGEEVAHRVETIASSEAATRMALALSRGSTDYGTYLNEAKVVADNQQLDFLQFLDSRGTILSSAEWPAKFGYKENSLPVGPPPKDAFLRQEELPDGAALSLSAMREVALGDKPLYVIGGHRLDRDFLGSLGLPVGMRAMLYRNLAKGFSPQLLIPSAGTVQPLTLNTRQNGDRVMVEITDTGTGLTAEECAYLFTPYYTSKAQGTGLGLAIVQSVISDPGGRISVRSEPGRGTTFMIELPGNLNKLQAAGPAPQTSSLTISGAAG